MKEKGKRDLAFGGALVGAFALWTALIQCVDVRPVGQNGTNIGFAGFNTWFHELTGAHMGLYAATDWLGLVPIAVCLGFGALGLAQLLKRRSLLKVDMDLILLGGYYVLVILAYLVFEMIPINYRPVLIDGVMEASYPSSTTLLVLAVMPTLQFQVDRRAASGRQEGGGRLCDCLFGVHGLGAAGFRGALVHGHCRGGVPQRGIVPAVPGRRRPDRQAVITASRPVRGAAFHTPRNLFTKYFSMFIQSPCPQISAYFAKLPLAGYAFLW